jgi:hypothetical protein
MFSVDLSSKGKVKQRQAPAKLSGVLSRKGAAKKGHVAAWHRAAECSKGSVGSGLASYSSASVWWTLVAYRVHGKG